MFRRIFNRSSTQRSDRAARRSIDRAANAALFETLEDRQLYSVASLTPPLAPPAPADNGAITVSADPDADMTGANFLGAAGNRSKFAVNDTIGGVDNDDYF